MLVTTRMEDIDKEVSVVEDNQKYITNKPVDTSVAEHLLQAIIEVIFEVTGGMPLTTQTGVLSHMIAFCETNLSEVS